MPFPLLRWIPDGRGRIAVVPRPAGEGALAGEIADLKRLGADWVVSFLPEEEAEILGLRSEAAACAEGGLRFASFPIRDGGVPADAREAIKFLRKIAAAVHRGGSAVLHCRAGVGRAGMMASALLVLLGRDPREAMEAVSRARGLPVPESSAQRAWVEGLAGGDLP